MKGTNDNHVHRSINSEKMDHLRADFRTNLVRKRKERKIRQTEMAQRLYLSQSGLSKCERGTRKFSEEILISYCDVMELDFVDLLRTTIESME